MISRISSLLSRHYVVGSIIVIILIWLNAKAETNQVILAEAPTIIVDQANNGTGLIQIRNVSEQPVKVLLTAQDFVSATNNNPRNPLGAKIAFSAPGDSASKPVYSLDSLAAGATQLVKVDVTNLWEAGESTAELQNNGQKIGVLKALKYVFPFTVKLQTETPDNPKVSFRHKKSSTLTLKNDDLMTYPVHWDLEIVGKKTSGDVLLPPNSTASIDVPAQDEWFTSKVGGLFKEETQDGRMTLSYSSSAGTADAPLHAKTIPLKAQLNYYSPITQQVLSTLTIFLVLFLGGFCSLIVSYWVPNRLRQRDLKEQLARLAIKTRDLSYQIDSSLRVLVRVERQRLNELLKSRSVFFSPDMANIFNQCGLGITTLNKKITLLENIDTTYEQLKKFDASFPPPSLLTRIEENLQKASLFLKNTEPQDSDFQAAQALIADANAQLNALNQVNPKFAQELAELVKSLLPEFDPANGAIGKTPKCQDIRNKLPGPFTALDSRFIEAANITLNNYSSLDRNTNKLKLIREYVEIFGSTQNKDQLLQHENELLDHLSHQSWGKMRSAEQLVRQMREGIFTSDFESEIKDDPPSIVMDPGVARPYRPVQLKAHIRRTKLNDSAARGDFTCVWAFDHDDLKEKGWAVSHYFILEREHKVEAWFEGPDGQQINDKDGRPILITKDIRVRSDPSVTYRDRFITEAILLSIVLIATLLALIAGAKDQLAKLDLVPGLIAIFLLGFTADQIKNLLTQRQQPSDRQ